MLMQTNLHSSTSVQALDGLRVAVTICIQLCNTESLMDTST